VIFSLFQIVLLPLPDLPFSKWRRLEPDQVHLSEIAPILTLMSFFNDFKTTFSLNFCRIYFVFFQFELDGIFPAGFKKLQYHRKNKL
jgi:hypothetical protein